MIKKRLFIAINLPEQALSVISRGLDETGKQFHQQGLEFPPSESWRLTPQESWHITVLFLDYQNEELLSNITTAMALTAEQFAPPAISLETISYGPPDRPPKMLWVQSSVETSRKLQEIRATLENTLVDNGVNFKQEYKRFNAHITLARFTETNPERLIPITTTLKPTLGFEGMSLDLMESELLRDGPRYTLLQSIPFQG